MHSVSFKSYFCVRFLILCQFCIRIKTAKIKLVPGLSPRFLQKGVVASIVYGFVLHATVAQQPLKIDLAKQGLKLEALQQSNTTLIKPTFYISRVVDARPLKTHIGIVQRGLTNAKAQAFLEGGLEKQVFDFFRRSLPEVKEYLPIIVKVNQLSIAEKTTAASETATAAVSVDFIASRNDSLYLLYQTSSLVKKGGMDVTGFHDNNIAAALSECMDNFMDNASPYNWQTYLSKAVYMSESALNEPLITQDKLPVWPIFQDSVLQRGIYTSLLEFRNNAPSDLQPFNIEARPRRGRDWDGVEKVTPYITLADGSHKNIKKVWGFCDGKQTYIYHQKDFFPLRKQAGGFVFDAYAPPDAAAIGAAGVMGGAIGGAIAGAATANRKQTYQLDGLTGQVTEWDGNNYLARTQLQNTTGGVAKIMLYYKAGKGATDAPVTVLLQGVSDTLRISLAMDSFAEVSWEDLLSQVNVCVESASNPCYYFVPNVTQVNYLEYLPAAAGTDEIIIRQVKAQEGEFYLKKIRYAQERNQKQQQK